MGDKLAKSIDKFLLHCNISYYFTKRSMDYFLIGVAFLLGTYNNWTLKMTFIFMGIIWTIIKVPSSKTFGKAGLLCLLLTLLFLIARRDLRAEEFATLAYYLLFMSVIMTAFEIKKRKG